MSRRLLTYNGETLDIGQWAKKLHINRFSLSTRLKFGWSMEKIATTAIRPKRQNSLSESMIDKGVEAWQFTMLCRGYFRKENRIKAYKMLNTWYKEFRSENMKAA